MRKVHREAPSFSNSRLPADSLIFANSRRFQFRAYSRLWLPIAVMLLAHLGVADVRAQVRIIVIEKNLKPVKPPTDEVTRIAGSTRRAEPIRLLPSNLEAGDELIGNVETVSVRVRCGNSAEYAFSGKFRVRFLPAVAACHVSFDGKAGGTMIVDASIPTAVQTGETRLASRRTKYQVRIPTHVSHLPGANEVSGTAPEVLVFQHEVSVASPFFTGVVKEGEKLAAGAERPAIKKLELKDFREAVDIPTRLDIAQMIFQKWLCEACAGMRHSDPGTYQKLSDLRRSVLQNPNNKTKSTELEEALNDYGISEQIVLKPGEKRIVPVAFDSGCRNPIKVQATLSNVSFSRLVSEAVAVVRSGRSYWRVELGATGLPTGVYTAEIVFECLDCPKQNCALTSRVARVGFYVK